MSMLAGPKRKQKWTLNPRGKHWSEDNNKFGQKMLEKMGWSNGKGLGAKEQGIVEHIRVRVKNDQVGIGYNKDRDNQWTEHQDDFNNFLQNLQKELNTETVQTAEEIDKVFSGKSLEEKSKLSQKRVHYKKFTRGKDVNKYSAKDLANIFGKKDLNEKSIKEEKEDELEEVCDSVGSKDNTAGILTIKGGNMNEYFKKKFYANERNISQEENIESETEKYTGFGFSNKNKSKFYVNDNSFDKEDSDSDAGRYTGFGFSKSNETKSKIKKLNNLNYVFDNPCLDLNILDENSSVTRKIKTESVDSDCNDKITPRKRKSEYSYENEGLDMEYPDRPTPKKRKSEFTYENKALNIEFSDNTTTKTENNEFTYVNKALDFQASDKLTEMKGEKLKTISMSNGYENAALDLEVPDRPIPKKVKKNKESTVLSNGIENPALDLEFPDKPIPKKIKKNKRSEESSNGIENPSLDLEFPNEKAQKKSKKETESETFPNAYENAGLDLTFQDNPTPKKSKKYKENEVLPNEIETFTNGIDNPALDIEFSDTLTPKKVKRNKESELSSNGIENPALDLEILEISTPKKGKKSKKSEILSNGIENPALDLEFPDKETPKKVNKNREILVSQNGIHTPTLDTQFIERPQKTKRSKESEMLSNGFENPALDLHCPINELYSTTSYEVSRPICGVENNALDLSDENSSTKRVTFNDQVEYNTDIVKKKKKKKKLDKYEVINDKSKKSKSLEPVTFTNEALDDEVINLEEMENEVNERKSKKCKRRKERRISLLETIQETPEEETVSPRIVKEVEKDKDIQIVGEFICEDVQEIPTKNSCNKSLKKKKHKKCVAQKMNTIKELDEISETDYKIQEIDISEEVINVVKKQKKKKAKQLEFIEPTLDNTRIDEPEKENVCSEKKKLETENCKKHKKKKKSSDEDVVSLEEFLNEEISSEKRPKLVKQNGEVDACAMESNEIGIDQKCEDNNFQSSYQKLKSSKQAMKSLFIRNPILLFKGSNINEIKGYGSQAYNNY